MKSPACAAHGGLEAHTVGDCHTRDKGAQSCVSLHCRSVTHARCGESFAGGQRARVVSAAAPVWEELTRSREKHWRRSRGWVRGSMVGHQRPAACDRISGVTGEHAWHRLQHTCCVAAVTLIGFPATCCADNAGPHAVTWKVSFILLFALFSITLTLEVMWSPVSPPGPQLQGSLRVGVEEESWQSCTWAPAPAWLLPTHALSHQASLPGPLWRRERDLTQSAFCVFLRGLRSVSLTSFAFVVTA